MSEAPLVSVLIPAFNAAPWITDCLESACGLEGVSTEIIVVDDGSTDDTAAIAGRFADRGVRAIRQPNRGASAARNRAIAESRGDWLQFLDADDLLAPDKVRLQLAALANAPRGCVGVSAVCHFADGSPPGSGVRENGWPLADTDDPAAWLVDLYGGHGRQGMVQTAQWLVPRAVAQRAGPWDESLTLDDDGEYFARVVLASRGLRQSPGAWVYFRKHRNGANLSASGARSERHLRSGLRALQLRASHLLAATRDPRAKTALAACFSQLAVNAYPRHPAIYREAREEIRLLGGTFRVPQLGERADRLRRFVGWRLARRASRWWHR